MCMAPYGDTPLYVASQEEHVEVVKALLAQPNIDVNQARTDLEWKGISPFWIASFNRHAEVVKELLKESEIKVNQAQTTDGRTALYIASIKGFLEVVQVFLCIQGSMSIRPGLIMGILPSMLHPKRDMWKL